jgi:hypothetical protein
VIKMDVDNGEQKKCRKVFASILFLLSESTTIFTPGMFVRRVLRSTPRCDKYADFSVARKEYWNALRSGPSGISHRIASEEFELTAADEVFIKSLPDRVHSQTMYAALDAVGAIPPAEGLAAMKEMSGLLPADDKAIIERLF